MTWNEIHQWAVDNLTCEFCGALPGDNCHSKSGAVQPIQRTHWKRSGMVHRVFWAGFQSGRDDAFQITANRAERDPSDALRWVREQVEAARTRKRPAA